MKNGNIFGATIWLRPEEKKAPMWTTHNLKKETRKYPRGGCDFTIMKMENLALATSISKFQSWHLNSVEVLSARKVSNTDFYKGKKMSDFGEFVFAKSNRVIGYDVDGK